LTVLGLRNYCSATQLDTMRAEMGVVNNFVSEFVIMRFAPTLLDSGIAPISVQ
jgi:hypothetical protein